MPKPSKLAQVSFHSLIIGTWQANKLAASNNAAKGTCSHANRLQCMSVQTMGCCDD